jgi:uncharacterized delta-60 repeat protein
VLELSGGFEQRPAHGLVNTSFIMTRTEPTHRKIPALLLLFLVLICPTAKAAPGDLDLSFDPGSGINGKVYALAPQAGGKVVVAGSFSAVKGLLRSNIARLHANGDGDAAFNPGNGTNGPVTALAVQADGKLVIGGAFTEFNSVARNGIVRLNSDGSLDTTFNPGTGVSGGGVSAIAVASDGKLWIGGTFTTVNGTDRGGIARLHPTGAVDPAFAPGAVFYSLSSVVPLADGKVLIGGAAPQIWRLNANGTRDPSFNPDTSGFSTVVALSLQPDGKILVGNLPAFDAAAPNGITRLNADGTADPTFQPVTGIDSYVHSVQLQADGKIIVAGYFTAAATTDRRGIVRLNANGSLDASFSANFDLVGPFTPVAVALQADGQVLLGGSFTTVNGVTRFRAARLNLSGSLDETFDPGSGVDGFVASILVQPDGKAIAGGQSIGRFHASGSPDNSFSRGLVFPGGVSSIGLQADSKIVLGAGADGVVRLNQNGTVDDAFQQLVPHDGLLPIVKAVAVRPDNKLFIAGGFVAVNDTARYSLALLNENGTVNSGFYRPDPFWDGEHFHTMVVQPDGKIVLAGLFYEPTTEDLGVLRAGVLRVLATGELDGSFARYIGGTETAVLSMVRQPDGKLLIGGRVGTGGFILRLNSTGGVDPSFNAGTPPNAPVRAIAVQPDGRILIGGEFSTVNGINRAGIARLNVTGTLDGSFNPGAGPNAAVLAIALQTDGRVLVGGAFSAFNGALRPYLVRLHGDAVIPPPSPEIAIEQPAGTLLVDGAASVHFGSIAPGSPVDRTFTVRNSGDAQLTGVSAIIGGTNASAFAMTAQPAASVAESNGSTTFIVRFTPTFRSTHSAKIQIASNDADENPFDIELNGTGANLMPTAYADSVATAYQTPVDINALANDSDPEGDVLTLMGASSPAHGTAQIVVTSGGQRIRYTPAAGFFGSDTFTYHISDGFGGSAIGTVTITVAAKPRGKKTISGGAAVIGAGAPGSGVPAGATWRTFGIPSIASNGAIAFGATIATPKGFVPVIYRGSSDEEPVSGAEHVVTGEGDLAPGAPGTTFGNFKDPLLNSEGTIVFMATLRGTPAGNNGGIWKHYADDGPGAATLVARLGDLPAGVPGARWNAFTSVAVSDGEAGNEIIAFTATMTPGPGGVRSHNDLGLWLADGSGIKMALREGAILTIGSAPKKVKSFVALQALPGAAGHGHGISTAHVLARLKFDDGSHGIVRVGLNEKGTEVSVVALWDEAPAGLSANLAGLGLPTQSGAGEACFTATLAQTKRGSDKAILQSMGSGVELVAREGEEAPEGNGAAFGTFTALAGDSAGRIAFSATLRGGAANAANDTAVFLQDGSTRDMIAREGGQPPGVPLGARWASFPSLALPETAGGPIFIGKLVTPAPGQLNPARITRRNNAGLWAVDASGVLQLIVRTGDTFDAERTITALTLLANVPGSPAQTRSFTATGQVIYRVTLDDGSQHVVAVLIP